tara:strand:+ start:294 stop:1178 length:885 start_codon:yes stop_codon:yes gene_type:complete
MAAAKKQEDKVIVTDFLENKTVTVKYIKKETNGVKDPKHVAHGGMLNGAEIAIPAPTMDNGKMKNLLTNVEKEGLESILDIDLSIYGSFWKKGGKAYEIGILPIFLTKDEMTLDLSSPYEYIKYKLLKVCPIVANSLDEVSHRATNRFVLTSPTEELAKAVEKGGYKVNAYKLYVKYDENKEVLRHALRHLGRNTNRNHKMDFLQAEMHKQLESNPSMVCSILGDKFIKTKVLLETCFENGAIKMLDKKYYTLDDEPISGGDTPTIDVASSYLASNLGQEMRLALEAKLKNIID